ncbi:MAG: N-acetyl-alpha-D-glucosaminyl L-malate synthase BshA [Candidatus Schekmanbacteria bacterium]|nr:N-acetyl-alpha-D-glucosaminyl L-malate synthase BshA [Candidatus Schekmanbacteria bacterium]
MSATERSPLRVGLVCYPTFGGSGVVAAELGRMLAQRGHEVHFICHNIPARLTPLPSGIQFHLVDVVSYPLLEFPPYTLALACAIYDVHEQHDLDIVHVHYAVPHATAAYLALDMTRHPPGIRGGVAAEASGGGRRPFPIVTTLHGTDIELLGRDPSYHTITAWSLQRSAAVTAVSSFLAQRTAREVIDVPIEVIPNFVDPDAFSPKSLPHLRALFASDDQPLICHISNLRGIKRIDDLIAFFLRLRRHVDCKLMVVGEGPDRERAFQRVNEAGVIGDVHFVGFTPFVQQYLQISDLFVLTSDMESFGLAVLEAMACAVPVVAYGVGGVPEVVGECGCASLVARGDLDTLAAAALHYLSDPAAAAAAGSAGRQRALGYFRADVIVSRYEELYYRLVRRRAGDA